MTLFLSQTTLPIIKADLQRAHSNSKSCQRTEALAAGLGCRTYGGLLKSLEAGAVSANVDNLLYCERLDVPLVDGCGEPSRQLSRAIARGMMHPVLDAQPELTLRGFDSIWQGDARELALPMTERRAAFQGRRDEAYYDGWSADQFELAMLFPSQQAMNKTLNRDASSYRIKHHAEGLSRHFGMFKELGNYVSNGMMIAAAYAAGYTVKPIRHTSYNAWFNISKRTLRASEGYDARRRRTDRPEVVSGMYGSLDSGRTVRRAT